MKNRLLFFFLAAVALSSCTKEGSDSVQVRFVNATGTPIKDITVDNLPIGDIATGETTEYYALNKLGKDTGLPDVEFIGTIGEMRVRSMSDFFWCGTEKSILEPGEYTVKVNLNTYNNQQYFYLQFE